MKLSSQASAPLAANNLTCPKILRHIYSNVHSLGGLLGIIIGRASIECGAQNASAGGCLASLSPQHGGAHLDSVAGEVNGCECGPRIPRAGTGQKGRESKNPNEHERSNIQKPNSETTTGSVHCRAGPKSRGLVLETDPEDHRVRLLEETFVVLNERAPQFRGGRSGEDDHGWTQTELVNRAIELHFQKGGRPSDLLCQGHQRAGAHVRRQGQPLPNTSGVECLGLSSAFAAVTSPPWELLLSRIGAPTMLHLLRNSSIFVPLPNGCLLQVCGRPITDLVWKKRLQPSAPLQRDPPQPANVSRKRKSARVADSSCGPEGSAHVRFVDGKRRRPTQPKGGNERREDGCARAAKQRAKAGSKRSLRETISFCGGRAVSHEVAERPDRKQKSGKFRNDEEKASVLDGQSHPALTHLSESEDVSEGPLSQEPVVRRMRGGAEGQNPCHVARFEAQGSIGQKAALERLRGASGGARGPGGGLEDVMRNKCDKGAAGLRKRGERLGEPVAEGRPEDLTPCLEPIHVRVSPGLSRREFGGSRADMDCASPAEPSDKDFGPLTQEESGREPEERPSEGTAPDAGKRKRVRESSWQRKRRRRAAAERDATSERASLEGLEGLEEEPVTQEPALAGAWKKSHRVVIQGKGASVAVSRRKTPGVHEVERFRRADQSNCLPNSCETASVRRFGPGGRIGTRAEERDPFRSDLKKRPLDQTEPMLPRRSEARSSKPGAATQRPAAPAKGSPTVRAAKSGPRLLPRAAMFYNASHGRKAGLPTSHILSSLGTDGAAAKALVWHVFEPASAAPMIAQPKPRTSFQAAFGSVRPETATGAANTEAKEWRAPRQLQAVLPLFRDLLVLVKKLDLGRLLARHCPLPETLRKTRGDRRPHAGNAKRGGKEEERGRDGECPESGPEPDLPSTCKPDSMTGVERRFVAGLATGLASEASGRRLDREEKERGGPVEASRGSKEQGEDADCMSVQGLSDGYLTQDEEDRGRVLEWRGGQDENEDECMSEDENPRHEAGSNYAFEKTGSVAQQEAEAGNSRHGNAGDVEQNRAFSCAPPSQHSAGDSGGLAALLPTHLAPDATYKQLIGQFCEHCHVAAFVWTALRKAVPGALLGGPRGSASGRALRGHVNRFVRLGRFETMSLTELMHGLRLADFPWLWEGDSRSEGVVPRGAPGGGLERSAGDGGMGGSGGLATGELQSGVVLAGESGPVEVTGRVQAFLRENAWLPDAVGTGSPFHFDADVPLTQEPQIRVSHTQSPLQAAPHSTPAKQMPKFPPEKTAALRRRLSEWLYFLFASLVVPLLRSHFYVTESEPHKQKVFYYRKPLWRHLAALSVRHLAGPGGPYCHVSAGSAEALLASKGRVFGPAEMRLLPKANGMRPIARLGAKSVVRIETRADQRSVSTAGVRSPFRRRNSLGGLQRRRNGLEGGHVREQRWSSNSFGHQQDVSGRESAGLGPQADGFERVADIFGRGSTTVGRKRDGVGRNADGTGRNADPFGRPGARGFAGAATTAASCPLPTSKVLEFGAPNKLLGDAHAILKLEKWRGSEDLGCSVFGFDDIHAKLRGFVRGLRTKPGAPMPKVFMAGCDIAAAYDTIPQEFLWQIVQALFRSPVYQLLWNARATPAFGAVRVRGEKLATSVDVSEPHVAYRAFQEALRRLTSQKAGGAVFVDQVNCSEISRGKQLQLIREHLFGSVVRYGRAYLHQRRGIAQGSILSTLFCSFFYAHLENNVLMPLLERKACEEALSGGSGTEPDSGTELVSGRAGAKSGDRASGGEPGVGQQDGRFGSERNGRGLNGMISPDRPQESDVSEAVLLRRRSKSEEANVTAGLGAGLGEGFGAGRPLEEGLFPSSPARALSDGVNEPPEPRTPEHDGTEAWLRMESSETESEAEGPDGGFSGGVEIDSGEGGCFWEIEQGYASQDEGTSPGERGWGSVGRGDDWPGREPPWETTSRQRVTTCTAPLERAPKTGTTRAEENRGESRNIGTQLERDAAAGGTSDHGVDRRNEKRPAPANENGPRSSGSGPQSLLMRWVDDSLFLSTSKRHVAAYLGAMHAGFPAYGAEANPAKTCLNFDLNDEQGGLRAQNMYVDGSGRSFIRWCGLLLNSETLEVQADYTRYSGEYIRDSMAVDVTKGRRGAILADRLCLWLRPKCHAVFFDTAINSPTTVRLNIYQAFLLCAIKFHCFLSASGGDPRSNPEFLAREIWKAIGYLSAAVGTAREAARRRGTGCSGKVSKSQVLWLGLRAFRRVLSRKQTQYQPLLKLLADDFGREAKQLSETLSAAVAPDLSAVFDQILY